jgi:hypothetical protein
MRKWDQEKLRLKVPGIGEIAILNLNKEKAGR